MFSLGVIASVGSFLVGGESVCSIVGHGCTFVVVFYHFLHYHDFLLVIFHDDDLRNVGRYRIHDGSCEIGYSSTSRFKIVRVVVGVCYVGDYLLPTIGYILFKT